MAFNNLSFLFLFLPAILLIYYICPKRFRDIPLIIGSLIFYSWGTPAYVLILLFSIGFNYVTGLQLASFRAQEKTKAAKSALIASVVVNLLLLGFFKYWGFLLDNINAVTGLSIHSADLPLPLGISFFTFTVLSYDFDVYRGKAEVQRNILKFAVFVSFFPKVTSGPIVQYRDMEAQLAEPKEFQLTRIGAGLAMFLVGLAKKVLISDNLGTLFSAVSGLTSMSIGTAWLGMILYSFQLYFDFSGYSDMAIGIAKMLGYDFEPNFSYPYRSVNITDFWRRWHISLGAWFRDYVYIPLGGSRCSKGKIFRNLLVVWLLTGLWHGAAWSFIAWGLWHGMFAMLERFVIKDRMDRIPHGIRVFLTCLIAFFGWVMFFSGSLSGMLQYFGQMFGAGHLGLFDSTFLYYFRSSFLLLVISVIGSGPMVHQLFQNLTFRRGGTMVFISAIVYALLLVLSIACMVSATYSSFLYFQF